MEPDLDCKWDELVFESQSHPVRRQLSETGRSRDGEQYPLRSTLDELVLCP
jgi:hypothetical protein